MILKLKKNIQDLKDSIYTAGFKNHQRQNAVQPLQLLSLTGRLMVAITEGPDRFQEEFNEIARELSKGDEELYDRIQSEAAGGVLEFKTASQKLVTGQPLDDPTAQEARWFGWILWPISWAKNNLIMLTLRMIVFTKNLIAFII